MSSAMIDYLATYWKHKSTGRVFKVIGIHTNVVIYPEDLEWISLSLFDGRYYQNVNNLDELFERYDVTTIHAYNKQSI